MTETLTALIAIEAIGPLSTMIIAALGPLSLALVATPALRRFAWKMRVALGRPDHVLWRDGEQR